MTLDVGIFTESFEGGAPGATVSTANTIFENITGTGGATALFVADPGGSGQAVRRDTSNPLVLTTVTMELPDPTPSTRPPEITFDSLFEEWWVINGPFYEDLGFTKEQVRDLLLAEGEEAGADSLYGELYPNYIAWAQVDTYVEDQGLNLGGLSEAPVGLVRVGGALLQAVLRPEGVFLRLGGDPLSAFQVPVNVPLRLDIVPSQVTVTSGGSPVGVYPLGGTSDALALGGVAVASIANSVEGVPIWFRSYVSHLTGEVVASTPTPPDPPSRRRRPTRMYPRHDGQNLSSAPRMFGGFT